jgi:aminoglycoside N3'-acetyltransferase
LILGKIVYNKITMINKQGILKAFDFCKGRKVMLHANYEAFGKVEGGPETVVEAFIELTDLILFPTFNFHSWTESHYWDQVETPSERGIISETARQLIPRTLHPIYSFAVFSDDIQLRQRYLRCRNHEAVDVMGSPFAEFYRDDGLIVSIGYESLNDISASVQYAELKAKAPYRRIKGFHGIYKEAMQRPNLRTFSMFVREPGVVTAIDPAVDEMVTNDIIWKGSILGWSGSIEGWGTLFKVPMKAFCDRIEWHVRHKSEALHKRGVE